ncbi:MAG: hypothetical protein M1822_006059 [Bathelium mastoideum]|nr:MAG: hypothetical protein M1822_006059 [Bathelium mastoideum]
MADPLTVIGAASSCISVIEPLGKSISTAHKIRGQWKDADLEFYNLVTQLVSLKAALSKIKAWTESDAAASHHQLTMDLDSSIACCRVLVNKINAFLSELAQKPGQALNVSAKGRFLLGNKSLNDTQKMLERQINALSLLLNVCHLETASEQKAFLEKSSTRKAFEKVANDSASLIIHRDASSFRSIYSDSWSKLSMKFTFDNQLFGSKVYQQFVRGSLKVALRQQLSDGQSIHIRKAIKESEAIDTQLRIDRRILEREFNIFILGLDDWERFKFGRGLHLASLHGTSLQSERLSYRKTIFATFLKGFNTILTAMRERGSDFEDESNASYANYIASNFKSDSGEQELSDINRMYESLSDDRAFRTTLSTWDDHPLQDCFM